MGPHSSRKTPVIIYRYLVVGEGSRELTQQATNLHVRPPFCELRYTRFYNRSTSTIDATYHLGQSDIPSLDRCKDLGIIFSADLSWSHHYNHILAKAYRQLGLIRRTFSSSVSTPDTLHQMTFDPHEGPGQINYWFGGTNVTAHTHYDTSHNLHVLIHGRKKFLIFPPSAYGQLSLYPCLHQLYRQTQVKCYAYH